MKKTITTIAMVLSLISCNDKEQEAFKDTTNQQCEKIWYILNSDIEYEITHRSYVTGAQPTNGKVFLGGRKSYEIICPK
jgi:uncharacterized lipoprotein NlpE involved in copper resistance